MRNRLAIAEWLPQYQRAWLAPDLLSGAAVWAVLVPTAMAYAGLVGVDPVVGLYTVPEQPVDIKIVLIPKISKTPSGECGVICR